MSTNSPQVDTDDLNRTLTPVDLDLRIRSHNVPEGVVLEYDLSSPSGKVSLHARRIRSEPISEPDKLRDSVLNQLEKLHDGMDIEGGSLAREEVLRDLVTLGRDLYERLFPEALRTAYRGFRDVARSLLLTTDDPWIPWELVKPYDDRDDDFFCLQFQMSRWLSNSSAPHASLSVQRLAVIEAGEVAGMSPLPHASGERGFLERLGHETGTDVVSLVKPTFSAVERLLGDGTHELIHFVGHGEHHASQPDESKINLVDQPFRVRHLSGLLRERLRQARPFIFFNACWANRPGRWSTGLGGWGERFVRQCGCSGFLAPLWQIDDHRSRLFSRTFYQKLHAGRFLAEALRQTRRELYMDGAGDLTWIAYVLYGHPNALVTFGCDILKEGSTTKPSPPFGEVAHEKADRAPTTDERVAAHLSSGITDTGSEEKELFHKAVALFLLEDYPGARTSLNQLVEQGGSPRYILNLSYLLYLEGDYHESLATCREFIHREPYTVEAYLNAFKTCIALKDLEEARRYCNAAQTLAPERTDVKKAYAQYLLESGDFRGFLNSMEGIPDRAIFSRPSDNSIKRIQENASVLVGEGRVSVLIAVFEGTGLRTALLGYRESNNILPRPKGNFRWFPMTEKARKTMKIEELAVEEDSVGMLGYRVNGLEDGSEATLHGFIIMDFRFPDLRNLPGSLCGGLMLVDCDRQLRLEPRKIHVRELLGESEGDLVDLYQELVHPRASFQTKPGESPRVFLAYAREDQELAEMIFSGLERRGIDVWKDTEALRIGERFKDRIDDVIEQSDFAIVCLSSLSVKKPGFIQREFRRILEVEKYRPLGLPFALPIKLDNCEVPRAFQAMHWMEIPEDRELFLDRLAADIEAHFGSLS